MSDQQKEKNYQCYNKKCFIDVIQCISFYTQDYLLCGDETGFIHIYQTNSMKRLCYQKMFDLTLDKIIGPFESSRYLLLSQFSPSIKLIQINSQINSSDGFNDTNIIEKSETTKFPTMIQFIEKLSDSEFAIGFKCGLLKFYRFEEDNEWDGVEERNQINFIENCSYQFKNQITHLSQVSSDIIVCCSSRDLIILNRNKKTVEYQCNLVLDNLSYILPYIKDTFLVANLNGEMKLIFYSKTKRTLHHIQHYTLPQTNILTSLSKFGRNSLLYTSEKGSFTYNFMSHQSTCLHSSYSTVSAISPALLSSNQTSFSSQNNGSNNVYQNNLSFQNQYDDKYLSDIIVIADKQSFVNIFTQVKQNA